MSRFGLRQPTDDRHIQLYPLRTLMPRTVDHVERVLPLNHSYRIKYDQGEEGACVGASSSIAMSFFNRRFYDFQWLYRTAQEIDEWPDTPPQEGTSVRAGMDVLRDVGHRRIFRGRTYEPSLDEGITENRWAKSVDELRTSIAAGAPAVLGIEWFEAFDYPERVGRDWWIGRGDLGEILGGHAICAYGASDRREAIKLCNSWGLGYPLVWVPYRTVEKLLAGFDWPGEASVITDRI